MNFLDIAQTRYTTKKYDGNAKINPDIIEQLKAIIRLSPSSINSQPWRFSFIENTEIKQQFAEVSYWNAQKIKDASHLVIFSRINDLTLLEVQIADQENKGNLDYYTNYVKPKGEEKILSWVENQVYLSLGFFLSACASLGIDSTPMEGIENDKYDEILGLNGYKTLFAVAIGFRDQADVNQPKITEKRRIMKDKIVHTL